MNDAESKLCGLIAGKARLLQEDLRLHVSLPTGGNNRSALNETRERLMQRLARLGAKVQIVPGDEKPSWLHGVHSGGHVPPVAVCRRPSRKEIRMPVLISGHLDTVHDPNGPFKSLTPSSDGKTATGPGCVDMKGGLVIALAALEALDEAGIDCDWTVIFNSDEETGSYHSEKALRIEARQCLERGGVGLVLEPALPDGGLVVERLGSGQFVIETRGRSAHVGRDFERGISAVTALAERLVTVAKMPDVTRGLIVNVGPIEGGTATNVVPDVARAWGNVRFPNKAAADEIEAKLKGLEAPGNNANETEGFRSQNASARSENEPGLPIVKVQTSFNRPAKPLTPTTQKLAELARSVAEGLGQKLPFGKTGGVCDGNILQDEGLPTIDTLGVRGGGLHTPHEWIELASLVERCQLFGVLISRLAGEGLEGR